MTVFIILSYIKIYRRWVTLQSITIRCKKLARIVLGWKNPTWLYPNFSFDIQMVVFVSKGIFANFLHPIVLLCRIPPVMIHNINLCYFLFHEVYQLKYIICKNIFVIHSIENLLKQITIQQVWFNLFFKFDINSLAHNTYFLKKSFSFYLTCSTKEWIFTLFYVHKKKALDSWKFSTSVFDGFTCFEMSWTRFDHF